MGHLAGKAESPCALTVVTRHEQRAGSHAHVETLVVSLRGGLKGCTDGLDWKVQTAFYFVRRLL